MLNWPAWVIGAMAVAGFRWVHNTALDYVLKGVAIVVIIDVGARIFVILHEPGHFKTAFNRVKLKRLAKRAEAAWVWRDIERSLKLAQAMKPLAGDLWAATGDPVARFWLAVSLFVLATEPRLSQVEKARLLARAKDTAKDSAYRINDIANLSDLGMTDGPAVVRVLGVEVIRESRGWRSHYTVHISAPPNVVYEVLYNLPRFYEVVGSRGKVVELRPGARNLPEWRARFIPGVSIRYRTESAQCPWRLCRTTSGFGIRSRGEYLLAADDDGGTTLSQDIFVSRARFPWRLDTYVEGQIQSLRSLKAYYGRAPVARR